MNVFDWLLSPSGIEVSHALVVIALSVNGLLTWLTKRQSEQNAKLLDGHLESHKILTDAEHGHNP